MTAALSPGLSWLVIIALLAVVAVIYVYAVGSDWLERSERELHRLAKANPSRTFVDPADAHIRISGGVYDAEARGDFLADDDPALARWVWDEDEWKGYP